MPPVVREEPEPPTAAQFMAMLAYVPLRYRLPLVVIEQTAMRVDEAATIAWGGVDVAGSRFRLRRGETKSTGPLGAAVRLADGDDRGDLPARRLHPRAGVFVGSNSDIAHTVMSGACRTAKITHQHRMICVTGA